MRPRQLSRYSYSLRAVRSGVRTLLKARFSPIVQTGPEGSLSLLYNEYPVSLQEVKRPERGVNQPLAPRLKKE